MIRQSPAGRSARSQVGNRQEEDRKGLGSERRDRRDEVHRAEGGGDVGPQRPPAGEENWSQCQGHGDGVWRSAFV